MDCRCLNNVYADVDDVKIEDGKNSGGKSDVDDVKDAVGVGADKGESRCSDYEKAGNRCETQLNVSISDALTQEVGLNVEVEIE